MVRLRYNGDVRTADLLVGDMEASRQLSRLAHLASRWQALAQDRRWPALILALHLILGAIYSAVVPLWEAYDEVGHFDYVRYVATYRALPPADQKISEFLDESHQPPLYYILGAIAISWIDASDQLKPVPNFHARDGTGQRGFNLFVHGDNERFPWRGTVLALHVARLVSVVITTGTLWLTYLIGRKLFPGHPAMALGAMTVSAFLPQFLFIGAIVNNDSLMTLVSSAVLLAGLQLIHRPPRGRDLAALGAALGLSLLTKNNGLAFIPFVGLTLILAAKQHSASWRRLILWGGVAFGVAALLGGPWYSYNLVRYGRPIIDRAAENPIIRTVEPFGESVRETASLGWMATLINNTFRTFWAAFGWGNIIYPDGLYLALGVVCLVGLAGAVWMAFRSEGYVRLGLVLILIHALLVASLAIYRAVYFRDPMLVPGRYLLPSVAGLGLMLFGGWATWVRPIWRPMLAAGVAVPLGVLALVTPWMTIAPAYARPQMLSLAEAMEGMNPVYLRFGDGMELLGYQISPERITPGETLWVTLVWRGRAQMRENYTVGIHLLDGYLRDWGQIDMYPGRGNYATSLWRPGDIFRDTYPVRLRPNAPAPAMGRIAVGVQLSQPDAPSVGTPLPVTDEQGRTVTPIFGRFKIAPVTPFPLPSTPVRFRLGEGLVLTEIELSAGVVHPGEAVQVRLTWGVQAPVGADYTVFLHALSDGEPRFQADRPPLEGAYPTGLWEAGEVVTDTITLTVPSGTPPGRYRLVTGLYDPQTGARLPAFAATGERQPGDALPLGEIQVAP
ncbi:MAG: hypothetical protein C4309_00290 [Chloroflexota bacterium]